jgi:CDP-diacylglycerol--glycerol-3-phosphate 3-phosphatidyltransferase
MNIPNIITSLRVVLIPVIIILYYLPVPWHYLAASFAFILASISDWLDGYLARKWDQQTKFGAFFDPVADKLIVCVALVLLVQEHASVWLTIPAVIIIGREIVISALREWMAELGKRTSVAVSFIGKLKTTFQMISIIVLLSDAPGSMPAFLGLICLYVAAILTLWSMIIYLNAAWADLTEDI